MPDTLVDIHWVIREALKADAQLATHVADRVYARNYPQNVVLPAVRVEFPTAGIATPPAPRWWTYFGMVRVHADTHPIAMVISREVQNALARLEGTVSQQVVLQSVDAWSVQNGEDTEWTPAKPEWSVAVEITARADN